MPPFHNLKKASHNLKKASVISSSSLGAFNVRFHPAAVADSFAHLNRAKDETACNKEGFGILLGVQHEEMVDVYQSVEVVVVDPIGSGIFSSLYDAIMSSRFLVPAMGFIGWYYIGKGVQEIHVRTHMEIINHFRRPIYVLFNTKEGLLPTDLVTIYELGISNVTMLKRPHFVRSCCTFEIVEANERKTASDLIALPSGKGKIVEANERKTASDLIALPCGKGANCKHQRAFRTMLLETPSGFAMFHISERVFNYPEIIWAWFTNPDDTKDVICTLGFIKVENKSVVWNSDVGPGQDLKQFIQERFNNTKKELIVPDLQLKHVIEKNIGINCWFISYIVRELTWGLNYVLDVLVPEEKGNCAFPQPLSRGLEMKIRAYGLNISPLLIDREFINMVGHLNYLDFTFNTASRILHKRFGHHFPGRSSICDEKSLEAIKSMVSSLEMATDEKKEVHEFISIISSFPDKKKAALSFLKKIEVACFDDTEDTNQVTKQATDQVVGSSFRPWGTTFCVGFACTLVNSLLKHQ